jgi:hypothetical protein
MFKSYQFLTACAVIALAVGATSAQAAVVEFDFAAPTGNLGSSHIFTLGGISITAKGFTSSHPATNPETFTTADLNIKFNGTGNQETGLGIAGTGSADNEIVGSEGDAILFDLGTNTSGVSIEMGSVTDGESFNISTASAFDGTDAAGFTSLVTGDKVTNPSFVTLTGVHEFLLVTETGGGQNGNVLIDALRVGAPTPVPEPATLALFGAGLFGLGMIRRRKQN